MADKGAFTQSKISKISYCNFVRNLSMLMKKTGVNRISIYINDLFMTYLILNTNL
jgi:hypothetical protein